MSSHPLIELAGVSKVYPLPSGDVVALDNLSLGIDEGEFVAIMGPSGSGKSTLLNQIGCLDVPTSGTLRIKGSDIGSLRDHELTDLRLNTLGYIFQKFNLIGLLTAYENVEYPYILKHRHPDESGIVAEMLRKVGIDEKLSAHRPNELSGGQQQRVAIARALINDPAILLCDEPTGNLDTRTGGQIMEMLAELNREGRTVIMVTHDPAIARYAGRSITIQDGRVA
ncbi:putative ABC transport system ATP-binding protein [Methanolinea mesophila]|uniref:ABC transporter ATP-binding protein n=1 Tax=Methanolinea mesophila TaxID=547055 RepID=UPI001AE2A60E|nr:ABC transporter ATP-binding protein [Methanolinea mesophila]MBP1929216.1 putative ABC transport system ATP-binding protein [Methanolinea mesophila]